MGFHKEGDCRTCDGIGAVVDDKDRDKMYDEAERMTDKNGFMSLAMAIKELYNKGSYSFHKCPDCGGTGIRKPE